MIQIFKQLDSVLRGDATRMAALKHGRIDIRVREIGLAVIAAAVVAGACMGSFAVVREGTGGLMQLFASAVKLPLLFILTLIVTFPSLYVFNALVGSRLAWESVLRLLVAANGVMLAVFASLGPIVVFFGLSTTSYSFMKLLNVLAAGIGGILGLAFLLRTLHRLVRVQEALDAAKVAELTAQAERVEQTAMEAEPLDELEPADGEGDAPGEEAGEEAASEAAPTESSSEDQAAASRVERFMAVKTQTEAEPELSITNDYDPTGALERLETATPEKAKAVFRVWVFVYAIVGAQMGWVLRPFIGAPGLEFTFLRDRESNFFLDFFETIGRLFGA